MCLSLRPLTRYLYMSKLVTLPGTSGALLRLVIDQLQKVTHEGCVNRLFPTKNLLRLRIMKLRQWSNSNLRK
ncbi:hypothetical protein P8452_77247 [Trifolium repens]|nr:hypothetical protein P8452_42847 [Trifolium repens]WJX58349.1 hypothetical protein P8452_43814 [Trifolium repens]WJX64090.1 hypothetical protein P8452_48913 [Trifolium repens]WJX66935.1 hypothetical protein P8452_51440 [Trifolium repens]WJX69865.1 hypothetical protein P8452_54038 [Trifolium repens]